MRAAGYSSADKDDDGRRMYQNAPPGFLNPLQALAASRARSSTLKFQNGRAIVADVDVVQPRPPIPAVQLADPRNASRYNLLPGTQPQQDFAAVPAAEAAYPLTSARAAAQGMLQAQAAGAANVAMGAMVGGGVGYMGMRTSSKTPSWLLYDGKILRFIVHWKESVLFSPLEGQRVRRGQLRYYLEDDTLEVVEPQEDNSGLPHGRFLHRGRVYLADGSPLKWGSLQVGTPLTMYSRTFTLASCDTPTRDWLAAHGCPQGPDQALPDGDFDVHQKEVDQTMRKPRPPQIRDERRGPSSMFEFQPEQSAMEKLREGKVLRFFCSWDDTARVFGQKLPFALHYFLADDTVEVVEVHLRNCGRDPFPLLLSKSRLPKTVPPVGGRPSSPRTRSMWAIEYYNWKDLMVGGIVKVYNRDMLIYAMDSATKEWYRTQLGVADSRMQDIPVEFDMSVKRPELQIPDHQGPRAGSEEDSMRNVMHLIPRAPPSDYNNYMANWSKVFRFTARMVAWDAEHPLTGPQDQKRSFIVSYHLLDKTVSIWESAAANSGLKGGLFLEKTRVRRHGSPAQGAPDYYEEKDFQVGVTLVIFSRGFQLLDADHATLKFQEQTAGQYPWAKYDLVVARMKRVLDGDPRCVSALRTQLLARDHQGTGYITRFDLHAAFVAAGIDATPHEAVTLVRRLGPDRQGVVMTQLLEALDVADDGLGGPPAGQERYVPPAPPLPRGVAPDEFARDQDGRDDRPYDALDRRYADLQQRGEGMSLRLGRVDDGRGDTPPTSAPAAAAGPTYAAPPTAYAAPPPPAFFAAPAPFAQASWAAPLPPPPAYPAGHYLNPRKAAQGAVPGLPMPPPRPIGTIPLYRTGEEARRGVYVPVVLPVPPAAGPLSGNPYRLPAAPLQAPALAAMTSWGDLPLAAAAPAAAVLARPAAGVSTRRPSGAAGAPLAAYPGAPAPTTSFGGAPLAASPPAAGGRQAWSDPGGLPPDDSRYSAGGAGAAAPGVGYQAHQQPQLSAPYAQQQAAPTRGGAQIQGAGVAGLLGGGMAAAPPQQYPSAPAPAQQYDGVSAAAQQYALLMDAGRAALSSLHIDGPRGGGGGGGGGVPYGRGPGTPPDLFGGGRPVGPGAAPGPGYPPAGRGLGLIQGRPDGQLSSAWQAAVAANAADAEAVAAARQAPGQSAAGGGDRGYTPYLASAAAGASEDGSQRPSSSSSSSRDPRFAPQPGSIGYVPDAAAAAGVRAGGGAAAQKAGSTFNRAAAAAAIVAASMLPQPRPPTAEIDYPQQYLTGAPIDKVVRQSQPPRGAGAGPRLSDGGGAPLPAAAALGVAGAGGHARPSSMWRTSNQAIGGVHSAAPQRDDNKRVSFM